MIYILNVVVLIYWYSPVIATDRITLYRKDVVSYFRCKAYCQMCARKIK